MIQGIVVTLSGPELKKLCKGRAEHHLRRAKVYTDQIKEMKRNKIEAAQMTAGDPIANLRSRMAQHNDEAAEIEVDPVIRPDLMEIKLC